MCIVRERRPAGFLDMKCQTCTIEIKSAILRSIFINLYTEIKSAILRSIFINLYTYVTTVCAIYAAIKKEMQTDNMIENRL